MARDLSLIGFHVDKKYCKKKGSTILENIEAAKRTLKQNNVAVIQIFVATPRGFVFTLHETDVESMRTYIHTTGTRIYAHARYFDVPWSSATKKSTITFMKREWNLCQAAGIKGFVIHLYRYPPERVVSVLKKLEPPPNLKIYLETPAISPMDAIYNSVQTLAFLYRECLKNNINVGICIDTCHLYASGLNLSDSTVADKFMNELTTMIEPANLLIHLNDSASTLGSGKDHHASIGVGNIWGPGRSKKSLWIILDYVMKYKIDCILERNDTNGALASDFKTISEYKLNR